MTQEQVEQTPEQIAVESDAAFSQGFNDMRGVPPVEKPVEQPKVEVTTEDPPKQEKPEVEVDPWEGVPPAVKAELESIGGKLKAVDQLDHRFKSFEGRLGKINSTLDTLAAAKAAATTVADAPSQTQIESSAEDDALWKQLQEDFPDWAKAMDRRLAQVKAAMPKAAAPVDVSGLKAEISGEFTKSLEPLLKEVEARARQMARVDTKHPDWEQTINTPEFEAWMAGQAPDVKALAASPKAQDAIRMLDAYEESRKKAEAAAKAKAANEARLKGAITPKGVPSASPATLNDDDAFESGFKSVRG